MDRIAKKLVSILFLIGTVCSPKSAFGGGVVAVAAREFDTAFIKSDGSLWTFGQNSQGECGNGTYSPTNVPQKVVESGVTAVACGYAHTLFLKADGSLWGMGGNWASQLGLPGFYLTNTPQLIVPGGVVKIFAGGSASFFMTQDGSLWGMGGNGSGEMGDGTYSPIDTPKKLSISNVVQVAAGFSHSLFLKSNGSLWGTGDNRYGQIGPVPQYPDWTYTNTPQLIVASNVVAVSASDFSTIFVKTDGIAWGLGWNYDYMFGNGSDEATNYFEPTACMLTDVQAVTHGMAHSLLLRSDGALWGAGRGGCFGVDLDGGATNAPCRTLAAGVRSFGAGWEHSVAAMNDGSLWATGTNGYGQLGDGTWDDRSDWEQIVAAPAAAFMIGLLPSASSVTINAWGTPGESYELQASTNLSDWTGLQTMVAQPDGSLQFLETLPPTSPARYYRCRLL